VFEKKIMSWNKSNLQDKEFGLRSSGWTRIMLITKEVLAIVKRKPNETNILLLGMGNL
jgi:hypothetical protein